MDVGTVSTPVDFGASAYASQTTSRTQADVNVPAAKTGDVAVKGVTASNDEKANKKSANLQDVTKMTEAMNKFVEAIDANIQFTIHQKTHELMVQIVDKENSRVLREFPSHEFLDTVAAIRSYVGMLLDKKV